MSILPGGKTVKIYGDDLQAQFGWHGYGEFYDKSWRPTKSGFKNFKKGFCDGLK